MQVEPVEIPWATGYSVCGQGGVYSTRGGKLKRLRPWLNSKGYEVVSIRLSSGARVRTLVHRAVARVFLGEPGDGLECCHRDGNRRNNKSENLYWGTRSENMRDTIEHGTHVSIARPERVPRGERHGSKTKPERVARGERSGSAKITEAQARSVLELAGAGVSISSAARRLGIPRGAAKCVAQGKTWKHLERAS